MALLHENLFRQTYQFSVVGPLADMTDVFLVVIVRGQDKDAVMVVSGAGEKISAENCQAVSGRNR